MNAHRSLLAVLILLSPLLLRAQVYESDNLFIPPTITVVDMMTGGPPLLKATEQHVRRRDPMLPIIFFDNPGEWTLPPRYHTFGSSSEADGYADTNEVWTMPIWNVWDVERKDTMSIWKDCEERNEYAKYYELLDVVGYRMSTHPLATITLHGGYSAEPGESPEIASERIATVRDYLTAIWRVAPERIAIGVTEQLSDTNDHLLDHQEARMVVIETENWELIRPVEYSLKWGEFDDYGRAGFLVRVKSNVHGLDVDSIVVTLYAGDEVISYGAVPGSPGMLSYDLHATCRRLDYRVLKASPSLKLDAYVRTTDGVYRRSHPVYIPREAITYAIPLQPNRVLLPFYTHGAASLTDYQRRMLGDVVTELKRDGKNPVDAFSTDIIRPCNEWESHLIDEKASPDYYHDLIGRMESLRTQSNRMTTEKGLNESFTLIRSDHVKPVIYSEESSDFICGLIGSDDTPYPEDHAFEVEKLDIVRLETIKAHILATYADSVAPAQHGERVYGIMDHTGWDVPLLPEQRWYHRSIAFTLFERHGAHR